MYELYDPCTVMTSAAARFFFLLAPPRRAAALDVRRHHLSPRRFFRNKHIMIDLGTAAEQNSGPSVLASPRPSRGRRQQSNAAKLSRNGLRLFRHRQQQQDQLGVDQHPGAHRPHRDRLPRRAQGPRPRRVAQGLLDEARTPASLVLLVDIPGRRVAAAPRAPRGYSVVFERTLLVPAGATERAPARRATGGIIPGRLRYRY